MKHNPPPPSMRELATRVAQAVRRELPQDVEFMVLLTPIAKDPPDVLVVGNMNLRRLPHAAVALERHYFEANNVDESLSRLNTRHATKGVPS